MAKARSEVRFIFYASAIFICYFIFAMLQEKITRGKYGENDKFTCALSLVLVQCFVNYLFAQILMVSWKHEKDTTRTVYYFSSALTYLLAMICSTMALQWINYPTQQFRTLVMSRLTTALSCSSNEQVNKLLTASGWKSSKTYPGYDTRVLIGRKAYPLRKYLFVLLIVTGVALFMYKDQAKKAGDGSQTFGVGELLLILSLTMDGLTGAVQELIKSESSPTAYSMMLHTNWWSTIISAVGVVFSGEIFRFVTFVSQYPEILVYLTSFALTGALGQLFIFFMVAEFGPLPCSVVTTTRKFFTVLASVIIFGNVLLTRQWIGAVLVFSGLFLDIFYSKGKSQASKKTPAK